MKSEMQILRFSLLGQSAVWNNVPKIVANLHSVVLIEIGFEQTQNGDQTNKQKQNIPRKGKAKLNKKQKRGQNLQFTYTAYH